MSGKQDCSMIIPLYYDSVPYASRGYFGISDEGFDSNWLHQQVMRTNTLYPFADTNAISIPIYMMHAYTHTHYSTMGLLPTV